MVSAITIITRFSQPLSEIGTLLTLQLGNLRPREVKTGAQDRWLPSLVLFSFSRLPPIVRLRALSEATGKAHLVEEMTEFTGTRKQAVKVFTLHTISCRVFTSGLAIANVQSQPG